MTFRMILGAAVASISGAAVAHETAFAHVHPHGADLIVLALGAAAFAFGGYKAGLFTAIRSRSDR